MTAYVWAWAFIPFAIWLHMLAILMIAQFQAEQLNLHSVVHTMTLCALAVMAVMFFHKIVKWRTEPSDPNAMISQRDLQ